MKQHKEGLILGLFIQVEYSKPILIAVVYSGVNLKSSVSLLRTSEPLDRPDIFIMTSPADG